MNVWPPSLFVGIRVPDISEDWHPARIVLRRELTRYANQLPARAAPQHEIRRGATRSMAGWTKHGHRHERMIATSDDPATETGFDYVIGWPAVAVDDAAAIRAFWRREGALADDALMDQRLAQVVMHARKKDGEVAGVCTAISMTLPRLGQPMYYWRTFVGARWRSSPLVMSLLKRSCLLLEEHARAHDFPCIGILLELENDRFRERGRMATWSSPRFVYIGRSDRGLDLRALYFKGARLKPPPKT